MTLPKRAERLTDESAEALAKGLTEAQRRGIDHLSSEWRRFNRHSAFDLPSGLMMWRPSESLGAIDLRLTPKGLAVRAILTRDKP